MYGQQKANNNYSNQFIKDCIVEIFQEHADKLVFNSNSIRLTMITDFLKNNFSVAYKPEYHGKKFDLVSSLGLNNKYNPSLQIDTHYDSRVFNPLKYKFPNYPRTKKMYRIDNTDYIVTIYPSK